jgi:hypothetical protein
MGGFFRLSRGSRHLSVQTWPAEKGDEKKHQAEAGSDHYDAARKTGADENWMKHSCRLAESNCRDKRKMIILSCF